MKRILWAFALSLVPSAAFGQFVDSPPGARSQRGADAGNLGKAPEQPAAKAPAFGAPDTNARVAAAAPTINRMFEAIDANGDGVISKTELTKAVVALRKLDADGDGNITLAEVSGPTGPAGPAANTNQMVDQAMTMYDKNKDGRLTMDELPPEMAMNFQMIDQNGDSSINRPELAAAMEKMQGMIGWGPGGAAAMNQAQVGNQMLRQMMQYDRNGDGKLSADEVPAQMKAMLNGADKNNDMMIDMQEVQAFILQMGQRAGRGFGADGPMGRGGVGDAPMNDPRGARRGR